METATMNVDLIGRRVVVAGASCGIGRSIALAMAEAGAAVSICARGAEALEATRANISAFGHPTHAAACDLSDLAAIEAYIAAAAEALGGIDVLVNNATGHGGSGTEESWAASVNVDMMAVVRASRAAQPFLTRECGANIINIASGSGLNPSPRSPAYGAAKAAVIHYTRTQAATLAASGIRVNCIAPGSIEFPGGVWDRRKTENPTLYNATLANCPMGRMGKAEEVADVAVFLASPRASWITAQVISVNGGQGLRGA
jgi:3-oxoacyl-[acyl-carrier protein] reductase